MPPKALIKENLSEQIYRSLRLGLMDGEYRPGERLTIASVSEQFGTSITPVREAIFRLASEQALEVKASTSIVVPDLTSRNLREIVAIRKELEGMAAYRVGQVATPAMIETFEAQNEAFMRAVATHPREAAQANRDFHFMILRFAEMPYVESVCENMWALMGPFLRTFHEEIPVRRLTPGNHLHFRFVDALKAGDADAACRAMREDIEWSNELITLREARGATAQGGA